MKSRKILFHKSARLVVREFSDLIRDRLGEALWMLQNGINLGFPLSRPMPVVNVGVYELSLKAVTGVYRIFYCTKSEEGILIIHAFTKKSQKTPNAEIRIARKHLKEMLCT